MRIIRPPIARRKRRAEKAKPRKRGWGQLAKRNIKARKRGLILRDPRLRVGLVLRTTANLFRGGAVPETMNDDKRLIRQLKREVKRAGTRKLRRYLKDPTAEPDDFDYGRNCSAAMNEKKTKVERNSFRSSK